MSSGELSISGHVAWPGDHDWDQARAAWNLASDRQPAAVAYVESAEDVAKVIGFASRRGLKVTGRGTGHGAVAIGALEQTILIKTERMRGVEIDEHAQTARVKAGVLAMELGAAAQARGLCSLPGSAPDVGVIGYTLGGGLSWLGRRYGFACNRVQAIELVGADGEIRRVDAENDSDLFWALRGGGGCAGALAKLDADFLMFAIGLPMTPELGEAIDGHLDHLEETMAPWRADGGYFNFAERSCAIDAILPADTHERLLEVKRRWDPDGIICANHELTVAPV